MENPFVLGLNHKTAPIEIREKIAISQSHLKKALSSLFSFDEKDNQECVILSTCNRTEFYSVGLTHKDILEWVENYFDIKIHGIQNYLYHHSGGDAVGHLMRVASGLDSMIIGEGQVLGQVKTALLAAQELKTTKSILNTVFNRAINCGKRSRTETKIGQGAVTVGTAAAHLAKNIFGNLELKQVLIIGAGKMSESAAKILKSKTVFVANRTYAKAQELAQKINGCAVKFDSLDEYLATCDIVISSTGASHHIISKNRIEDVILKRGDRPLFLIDIAVPRDIDPKVGELSQIYLYDIDDLNSIAAENLRERQAEIPKVEKIIEEEHEKYFIWRNSSIRNRNPVSN